ncbi:hypothetical protein [Maridesulfovibrio sp.]|uniref:hypothetical protein n=1 Tax=Maridesulfovibrio sp. TaxID=2795000 RepID=UPI002AA80021|nr:hypothetical protein [Maridesulfovibrio sp.]
MVLNQHKTVPVAIDSVKKIDGFEMARCTYFVIQAEQPHPISLGIVDTRIPLMLLNFIGVVLGSPESENGLFESPEAIQGLIDYVEFEDSPYLVDTEDIWLPISCLENVGDVFRGAIFRVGFDLFLTALQFRQSLSNIEAFTYMAKDFQQDVEFSRLETAALSEWSQNLIKEAKDAHRLEKEKSPESFLPRRELDDDLKPREEI